VKDQDVWEKDDNNKKVLNAINDFQNKQCNTYMKWKQINKQYIKKSDKLHEQSMYLNIEVCRPSCDNGEKLKNKVFLKRVNKIILVFFLFLSLPTYSLSKQLGCFKGLVLFGNYNDNLTIKIDDHKKSVEIDGLSFVSNTVSVYDELTKENLLTLQGDKTIGDKVYSFTFEESRNVLVIQ